jgi:hypothetical protein
MHSTSPIACEQRASGFARLSRPAQESCDMFPQLSMYTTSRNGVREQFQTRTTTAGGYCCRFQIIWLERLPALGSTETRCGNHLCWVGADSPGSSHVGRVSVQVEPNRPRSQATGRHLACANLTPFPYASVAALLALSFRDNRTLEELIQQVVRVVNELESDWR